MTSTTNNGEEKIPFWRDQRFWRVALQVAAVVLVIILLSVLFRNLTGNWTRRGTRFTYSFLTNAASFNIGETLISYTPNDNYARAFLVGLLNSLRVILLGFIFTTIVGTVAGIASFSENWLVRQISRVYVEIVRNTPLLLQLIVWYFTVFLRLPRPDNQIILFNSFYLSNTGIHIPWPSGSLLTWLSVLVLIAGTIVAFMLWTWRTRLIVERGESGQPQLIGIGAIAVISLLLLIFGLGWQIPQSPSSGQVQGGLRLSSEFCGLLFGLTFYTGAFIAEIVRGGIQSVSRGQWEAARSLGLHSGLVMRLVVFPQALRVIIPSLNSQYMNLAKNSSLALAVGFPDVFSVAATSLNQTGRSVELILIIAATYLLLNLIISVVMNQLNRAVQLKER
ncbi:amino acid ABC transporter permease [Leptolyngbya ohadii]|uniref:amino acid ABC transporter permease n=1 Tax=Leptolyngbya ohadii TaxID=1962290 RepID=UPI000B59D6BB|nr:ABC transporter permease subunit [Leptolyngbya ohadii]